MSLLIAAMIAMTPPVADAKKTTDFGVREIDQPSFGFKAMPLPAGVSIVSAPVVGAIDMAAVSALGARWGTVTSTYRSPQHNRAVGGVPNSYHLRNRAIDIARKPGVRHYQIAAAYKAAGYRLIESLDEGDHSHFAFAGVGEPGKTSIIPPVTTAAAVATMPGASMVTTGSKPTDFRIVFAPPATK